ncbi:glycosyltransferase [Maricaulis sp.]|uniref:glycosyltransferase n=1 Tax=Maricaulis sp. TaxID=1486257 RepID=UPI002B273F74|nr:glycosyltransferase [Maricaulis sp.]
MTEQGGFDYSVIIPTYNPGPPLIELIERLERTFTKMNVGRYEIVIVDDGSPSPEAPATLKSVGEREAVTVIRLTRNYGKPGAVMCGLNQSRGDRVLTLDDDLQQAPEDLEKLAVHNGHDVIIARYRNKKHDLMQRVTSRIKAQFDRVILGYEFPISPMKLLRRRVVEGMLLNSSDRPFIPALIQQVTTDIVAVDVEHHESAYPQSRYTFSRRLRQFSNLLVGNSNLLLRWLGVVGFLIMFASLSLAAFIIVRKLAGVQVEVGWSSLMVAVLMIGGLQLGAMSIIGQYLLRILNVSAKKPAYFIRDIDGVEYSDNRSGKESR